MFDQGMKSLRNCEASERSSQRLTEKNVIAKDSGLEMEILTDLDLNKAHSSHGGEVMRQFITGGWENEADVQTMVQLVLAVDIGGALPMKRASERIWVRKEKMVGVSDARADCVMVRLAQNDVIGVVEVKRPTYATIDIGGVSKRVGTLSSTQNLKQLYRYMLRMRAMTGIVHVFGILTNYNEWRFAWFSHSDKIASATTTGDVQVLSAMPSATTTANVQSICDDEQEPLPDTFHYSRIYSVRDEEKDLPYRIASVLWRMRCSLAWTDTRTNFFDESSESTRLSFVLTPEGRRMYISNVHKESKLTVGSYVLWAYLGEGSSGAVWEAYERVDGRSQMETTTKSSIFKGPCALKLLFCGRSAPSG